MDTLHNSSHTYKDIHKGKSAILFGTGPTLDEFSFDMVDKDTITLGVNFIGNHKFFDQSNNNHHILDYYFFGDRDRHMESVKDFNVRLGKFGAGTVNGFPNPLHLTPEEISDMGAIPYEIDNNKNCRLYTDITSRPLYGHSVSFAALHFILYTGVTKIYIVGQDCSGTKCFGDVDILNGTNYNEMAEFWINMNNDIIDMWSDVEIISINPVGLKGIFKEIN